MGLFNKLKQILKNIEQAQRSKAAEAYELEVKELNNIFSIMLFGSFVGMPSTPAHLGNELLLEMPVELELMINRVSLAHDPLAELFSVLDIG